MKVLIVSREERSRSFDTLFSGIAEYFPTTVVKLKKDQIRDFSNTVRGLGCENYERVIFDVPLRRIGRHFKVLRKVSGLILYEEDAYQEFVRYSKYYKKFIKIYRSIGACRLILTGYDIGERIKSAGLDVTVIPKAFDENHLRNLGLERDIELGYIGRIKNRIYRERRPFLRGLVEENGLQMLRTDPGTEYLQTLNRIKIFVSADLGLLEFMAKNFEAMACGCMLLAKRQSGIDEDMLGLKHMENVVLYDDLEDARKLLSSLHKSPELIKSIATCGEELVHERHTLGARVLPFVEAIKSEVKPVRDLEKSPSLWQRITEAWL